MESELEKHLVSALKRLERAYEEILKSQGYTREAEKVKILAEIIKEQVPREDTVPATR
jgi:hypothetical protein